MMDRWLPRQEQAPGGVKKLPAVDSYSSVMQKNSGERGGSCLYFAGEFFFPPSKYTNCLNHIPRHVTEHPDSSFPGSHGLRPYETAGEGASERPSKSVHITDAQDHTYTK